MQQLGSLDKQRVSHTCPDSTVSIGKAWICKPMRPLKLVGKPLVIIEYRSNSNSFSKLEALLPGWLESQYSMAHWQPPCPSGPGAATGPTPAPAPEGPTKLSPLREEHASAWDAFRHKPNLKLVPGGASFDNVCVLQQRPLKFRHKKEHKHLPKSGSPTHNIKTCDSVLARNT